MLGKSEITTTAKSTVYLPLNILDSVFPVQAMILEDLPFYIVLGMDFLSNYKVVINISKNSFQLETDTDQSLRKYMLFLTIANCTQGVKQLLM